jgi:hypothetical protein
MSKIKAEYKGKGWAEARAKAQKYAERMTDEEDAALKQASETTEDLAASMQALCTVTLHTLLASVPKMPTHCRRRHEASC